jgi:DNA-binding ferritin-like protein
MPQQPSSFFNKENEIDKSLQELKKREQKFKEQIKKQLNTNEKLLESCTKISHKYALLQQEGEEGPYTEGFENRVKEINKVLKEGTEALEELTNDLEKVISQIKKLLGLKEAEDQNHRWNPSNK